jgi:hypothetical protein
MMMLAPDGPKNVAVSSGLRMESRGRRTRQRLDREDSRAVNRIAWREVLFEDRHAEAATRELQRRIQAAGAASDYCHVMHGSHELKQRQQRAVFEP